MWNTLQSGAALWGRVVLELESWKEEGHPLPPGPNEQFLGANILRNNKFLRPFFIHTALGCGQPPPPPLQAHPCGGGLHCGTVVVVALLHVMQGPHVLLCSAQPV